VFNLAGFRDAPLPDDWQPQDLRCSGELPARDAIRGHCSLFAVPSFLDGPSIVLALLLLGWSGGYHNLFNNSMLSPLHRKCLDHQSEPNV
jgi:hypothetical protein